MAMVKPSNVQKIARQPENRSNQPPITGAIAGATPNIKVTRAISRWALVP